jgi:hypothetical protein
MLLVFEMATFAGSFLFWEDNHEDMPCA